MHCQIHSVCALVIRKVKLSWINDIALALSSAGQLMSLKIRDVIRIQDHVTQGQDHSFLVFLRPVNINTSIWADHVTAVAPIRARHRATWPTACLRVVRRASGALAVEAEVGKVCSRLDVKLSEGELFAKTTILPKSWLLQEVSI